MRRPAALPSHLINLKGTTNCATLYGVFREIFYLQIQQKQKKKKKTRMKRKIFRKATSDNNCMKYIIWK